MAEGSRKNRGECIHLWNIQRTIQYFERKECINGHFLTMKTKEILFKKLS